MPNLLASITNLTGGSAPVTFADVPGLSATVNVASVDSIILLIAGAPIQLATATNRTADYQFAVGGVREGPEMTLGFTDNDDEGSNGMMAYALTGLSGSQTFSLQWQRRLNIPDLDTARNKGFVIIELLDGEATLLVSVVNSTAGTAPAVYADIPGFSGVASVSSVDSIILFLANVTFLGEAAVDGTADLQFAVDGAREGPEITSCFADDVDLVGTGVLSHVKTGISGSKTFSCQWQDRQDAPSMDTARDRSFQVLELKSADLLVSVITSAAGAGAPATYADVPALSGVGVVDGSGSVVLMGMNLPIVFGSGDATADAQFADDGAREGPELTPVFHDRPEEGDCSGMMWAKTGITGSHTFSYQWQDRLNAPALDTARNRSFYVIDLKLAAAVAVTSDAIVNYAAQIGLVEDAGANQEALQEITEDNLPNAESLVSTVKDEIVNFESLVGLTADEIANFESLVGLTADEIANFESLLGVTKDAGPDFESKGLITQDESPNVEVEGLVTKDEVSNFESLIGAVADAGSNLESLISAIRNRGPNFESLVGLTVDAGVNLESLIDLMVDAGVNLESLISALKDQPVNFENLITVLKDAAVNLEAQATATADAGVGFESEVTVVRDEASNLETLVSVLKDIQAAYASEGLLTVDAVANFESLITVVKDASNVQLSTFLIIPIILALALPLDEQSGQPGDVEQLDLILSLDEE